MMRLRVRAARYSAPPCRPGRREVVSALPLGEGLHKPLESIRWVFCIGSLGFPIVVFLFVSYSQPRQWLLVRVGEAHFALAGAKCWAWLSEPGRIVALALRVSFRKAGVIRSALNRSFIMTAGNWRYASNIRFPCGSYSGRVLCAARMSRAVTFVSLRRPAGHVPGPSSLRGNRC